MSGGYGDFLASLLDSDNKATLLVQSLKEGFVPSAVSRIDLLAFAASSDHWLIRTSDRHLWFACSSCPVDHF